MGGGGSNASVSPVVPLTRADDLMSWADDVVEAAARMGGTSAADTSMADPGHVV